MRGSMRLKDLKSPKTVENPVSNLEPEPEPEVQRPLTPRQSADSTVFSENEVADLKFAFQCCLPAAGVTPKKTLPSMMTSRDYKGTDTVAVGLPIASLLELLQALGASIDLPTLEGCVAGVKKTLAQNQQREDAIRSADQSGRKLKLPFKGIFNSANIAQTADDAVNFSEFFLLMTGGDVAARLPNGTTWTEVVHHVRILHNAFSLSDANMNNELEYEELADCVNVLHSGYLVESDVRAMWELLSPDGKGFITFMEFVRGMERVLQHPELGKKFNLLGSNFLLSMIVDTPVNRVEERRIMANFSFLERIGMGAAARSTKQLSITYKKEIMKKAESRSFHVLSATQRQRLHRLHGNNMFLGFFFGLVSAVTCSAWEWYIGHELDTNGFHSYCFCLPDSLGVSDGCVRDQVCGCMGTGTGSPYAVANNATLLDMEPSKAFLKTEREEWCGRWDEHPSWPYCDWTMPDPSAGLAMPWQTDGVSELRIQSGDCRASTAEDALMFWQLNAPVLLACCTVEILCLYYASIKNAVRIANALDLILTPVNYDRAFVSNSLVRAALELGDDNDVLFGVNPLAEGKKRGAAWAALMVAAYKAKVVLSGFVAKILLRRVLGRGLVRDVQMFVAVPVTVAWNMIVAHVIMREAKLRGQGIATSVELFQDILYDLEQDLSKASERVKVQIARAIGCNIVKTGTLYPAKGAHLPGSDLALRRASNSVARWQKFCTGTPFKSWASPMSGKVRRRATSTMWASSCPNSQS